MGEAELDSSDQNTLHQRNEQQWRRVRYSRKDCRQEANRRGLTIRGPQKIFDSSIAHIGFLHSKQKGAFVPYHQLVFEKFWQRELDIKNPAMIISTLKQSGIQTLGFSENREETRHGS